MTSHTLALIYIAALIFNIGHVIASPSDKRPWTTSRKISGAVGVIGFTAAVWLCVNAL